MKVFTVTVAEGRHSGKAVDGQDEPRPPKPSDSDRMAITAACEAFIRDVLKPRFLPEIRPTEFNYCVDIFGEWRAGQAVVDQLSREAQEQDMGYSKS